MQTLISSTPTNHPNSTLIRHPALQGEGWVEHWMQAEVFALYAEVNLAHAMIGKVLRWDSVWTPSDNTEVSRLAVELSQEYELGRSFDVFILAMKEGGVSTQPIFRFLNAFREDRTLEEALESSGSVFPWVGEMVKTYFRLSERSAEVMAGALFWSHPQEFWQSIRLNLRQMGRLTPTLDHFFELRSLEQKSGQRFLQSLCGQSERRWKEVHQGADSLLFARELFLDGILSRMPLN